MATQTPTSPVTFKPGHRRQASDAGHFKELIRLEASDTLATELDRLLLTAPPALKNGFETEFKGYRQLFSTYLENSGKAIEWEKIKLLDEGAIKMYKELPTPNTTTTQPMLDKLVVLKLNGGLGTSMGCTGPKSLITVRNDLTFLDLNIQQLEKLNSTHKTNIPLVLMNSFNTDGDTSKILRKYSHVKVQCYSFLQSRFPRINKESLLPTAQTLSNVQTDDWYPPGHGDLYRSFYNSGLLNQFLEEGKEWMFVANIDNLGATVDLSILNFLCSDRSDGSHAPEFVMEVTDKTMADVKGGTLVEYDGKLRLLEIAQVPKDHIEEFKSVNKFKIFNTNNLWINLRAMKRVVEDENLHMEVIVNPKTRADGMNVIQLETAVGAAIKSFEGAVGINVPRSRFLPVKKTQDLLVVMSNLYTLHGGTLTMNTKRFFQTVPLVKLGTSFDKVSEFLRRFASIPHMLELEHLTVSGDVTFGKGVILRGNVIIIANHGSRIDIPPGALLENKIVSGNLRILEH